MSDKLPLPRIELRWTRCTNKRWLADGYQFVCRYELLIPLQTGDCRRKGNRDYLRVRIGGTKRGGENDPCTGKWAPNGYADAPFRDGAHAQWDSEALGNPPIYVVDLAGRAFKYPDKASSIAA